MYLTTTCENANKELRHDIAPPVSSPTETLADLSSPDMIISFTMTRISKIEVAIFYQDATNFYFSVKMCKVNWTLVK